MKDSFKTEPRPDAKFALLEQVQVNTSCRIGRVEHIYETLLEGRRVWTYGVVFRPAFGYAGEQRIDYMEHELSSIVSSVETASPKNTAPPKFQHDDVVRCPRFDLDGRVVVAIMQPKGWRYKVQSRYGGWFDAEEADLEPWLLARSVPKLPMSDSDLGEILRRRMQGIYAKPGDDVRYWCAVIQQAREVLGDFDIPLRKSVGGEDEKP